MRRNLAIVWNVRPVIDMASIADDELGGGYGVRRGPRLTRTKLRWAARSAAILGFTIQRQGV